MSPKRRVWAVVIAAVAMTVVLGAVFAVVVVVREIERDEQARRELAASGPTAEPPSHRIVAANAELVVVRVEPGRTVHSSKVWGRGKGRRHRPSHTKRPPISLVALDARGAERWRVGDMNRPDQISDRWVDDFDGNVLELSTGTITHLPSATHGPLMDLGDVLVHSSEQHGLRAFDADDPAQLLWTIPGEFGFYTYAHRFGDHLAFYNIRTGVIAEADGSHETIRLPAPAIGGFTNGVFVRTQHAMLRVSPTGELTGRLPGVAIGLNPLGRFGDLTIWQESGFDQMQPQFADRTQQSRVFAWHPDEHEVRWETETPHGSAHSTFRLHYAHLTDLDVALPRHACWPFRGERTDFMSARQFMRVVCLDLSDGSITFRGNVGLRDIQARHDSEGTTLSIDHDRVYTLVRLSDRPIRARSVEAEQVVLAGDHGWSLAAGPVVGVERFDATLSPGPSGARPLALDSVLNEPDP